MAHRRVSRVKPNDGGSRKRLGREGKQLSSLRGDEVVAHQHIQTSHTIRGSQIFAAIGNGCLGAVVRRHVGESVEIDKVVGYIVPIWVGRFLEHCLALDFFEPVHEKARYRAISLVTVEKDGKGAWDDASPDGEWEDVTSILDVAGGVLVDEIAASPPTCLDTCQQQQEGSRT